MLEKISNPDIEHRDPKFARRFYANMGAGVRAKALQQLFQTIGIGRKALISVSGNTLIISRCNTGNYKLFVDINATANRVNDF